jgi:hypothetical protein
MTNEYIGSLPSRSIAEGDHRAVLALLPEYVAIRMLGQQREPEWQPLEQHLLVCEPCRSEADALIELMTESYAGLIPTVLPPAAPDLAFLSQQAIVEYSTQEPQDAISTAEQKRDFPPILIAFSAVLLPRIRVPMATRSGAIRLRYSYEIPPSDDTKPTVTIEVLVHDDQPTIGLVRVCVEHPNFHPFDQAGSLVTLSVHGTNWCGTTDMNGICAFQDIPLDQMEHWQLTIGPQESHDSAV